MLFPPAGLTGQAELFFEIDTFMVFPSLSRAGLVVSI